MNDEQKAQIKADLHSGAARFASSANANAKAASGWRRWIWAIAAIVAAAIAFFTTSCTADYTQTADGNIHFSGTVVTPAPFAK